jgi:O-antigen/teichoic acid export membrane protein
MDRVPESETAAATSGQSDTPVTPAASSVRKSLLFSFIERYLAFLAQIVTTAVLARLLTPADYGVYTIAAVIISLTQTLRDFGSIGYVLQERDLTPARVRTVYGVSLLIGSLAACLVIAFSGMIAAFYQNESVRPVLLVLSLNFVLLPYGSLVVVLLRREMRFDTLLKVNVVSVLAHSAVAITLAAFGFRAISLAWASVVGYAATCLMGILTRGARPYRLSPGLSEWRRVASFGTIATASVVVSSIGEEAPDLIVGRLLGVDALGLYGRASGIVAAFNRLVSASVAPVAVSALAMRHRSGAEMRDEFIAATVMITGVAWPFFAFLSLMAFPIVRILCGDGWDAAVPIARILSISGAVAAMANLNQLVFQAKGAVNDSLRLHLHVQPLIIVAIILAAQFNLLIVAVAFILGNLIFLFYSYRYLDRLIGVSLAAVFKAARKSLVVTAASAIIPAGVLATSSEARIAPLVFASIGALLGWVAGVFLAGHPLAEELKSASRAVRRRLTKART